MSGRQTAPSPMQALIHGPPGASTSRKSRPTTRTNDAAHHVPGRDSKAARALVTPLCGARRSRPRTAHRFVVRALSPMHSSPPPRRARCARPGAGSQLVRGWNTSNPTTPQVPKTRITTTTLPASQRRPRRPPAASSAGAGTQPSARWAPGWPGASRPSSPRRWTSRSSWPRCPGDPPDADERIRVILDPDDPTKSVAIVPDAARGATSLLSWGAPGVR